MDHGSHGLRIKLNLTNNNSAMDIHSERMSHMGFQPPTPAIGNRSSSSAAAVSLLDCSISLPTWSLTARRGRKSTASATVTSVSNSDDLPNTKKRKIDKLCHDAIDTRLEDYLGFEIKKNKMDDELCNTTDKLMGLLENRIHLETKKSRIDELCNVIDTHPDQVGSSKNRMHLEIRKCKTAELCDTTTDSDKPIGLLKNNMQLETTKSKIDELCNIIDINFDRVSPSKKKVYQEQNNRILRNEYKCNICSKAFSSPRALGGHKSSHYKRNKTNTMLLPPLSKFDLLMKETTSTETQAQEVEILIRTTMETQTTPSLDSTETGQKRMMDFDLNKLPPMEDEEGIIESCFLHL